MWASTIWFLIVLTTAAAQGIEAEGAKNQTRQCRPVMLLHGLFENDKFTEPIATRIKKEYPGTDVFNSNAYPLLESLVPAWKQIYKQLGQELQDFCKKHPEGITLIGFATVYAPLIPLFQVPPFLDVMTNFYYKPEAQRTLSFSNYWNDPHQHDAYLKQNIFLPVINNEVPNKWSESFKEGFLKLKKHVTIAGPDDGVIIPWQSCQYSYFENLYPEVVDYHYSDLYTKDTFGLRTLDESGRWIKYVKNDTNHFQFLTDDTVYKEAILPYLDCKDPTELPVSTEPPTVEPPTTEVSPVMNQTANSPSL